MTGSKHKFSFAVLTSSDAGAKGERKDTSGDAVVEMMTASGFRLVHRDIVPDETDLIAERLKAWSDGCEVDIIVTTGGTGLGPRDVTPQATAAVVEFQVPGIAEAMRTETMRITPMAMLSRSVVGVRNGCLIVNLPGSPKGVRETLEVALTALSHGLEMLQGCHPSHSRVGVATPLTKVGCHSVFSRHRQNSLSTRCPYALPRPNHLSSHVR